MRSDPGARCEPAVIRLLPNQREAPLTRDERQAQLYADQPDRLLDLAEATGNRALRAVAWGMMRRERRRRK